MTEIAVRQPGSPCQACSVESQLQIDHVALDRAPFQVLGCPRLLLPIAQSGWHDPLTRTSVQSRLLRCGAAVNSRHRLARNPLEINIRRISKRPSILPISYPSSCVCVRDIWEAELRLGRVTAKGEVCVPKPALRTLGAIRLDVA
jgi:hypothetical protein